MSSMLDINEDDAFHFLSLVNTVIIFPPKYFYG